ncbi:hypothetical protein EW026_g422 [Hermanssonia centrifuga]|uniref:DUF6534 domain-containing protein n=1 Tax=Hermanssonia centrifuga TaxID=98765 RepID=A0A4S4KV70_9APHY|nr:hypothetical protein EW026_g422 [Hermanssonia centrifuga]
MLTPITPPSLNNTLGVIFLGDVLAAILYGVTSLQTYLYYRCNQDGKGLKGLTFFSFVSIPASIVMVVECVLHRSFIQVSRFSWIIYTSFGSSLIADIIMAGTLCVMLSKRRTGFKRTDSIIHTLMLYSITTGALSTFFEGAVVVAYAVWPNDYIYLALYFIMPKLLLNSLLASLNARENLRQREALQA